MPTVSFRALCCYLLASAILCAVQTATAGDQRYQPLAASMKAALHASVADRASPNLIFADPLEGQFWLSQMSLRLAKHIPDKQSRIDFLTTVQYESKRAGLDPHLVLGVIDTESKFRKYAVSRAGARGYMQVMPFWIPLIGSQQHNLFNLRTNLRYGCIILRHYLDIERGDLHRALARYNGSLAKKSGYSDKVVHAWQMRWALAIDGVKRVAVENPSPVRYLGESQ